MLATYRTSIKSNTRPHTHQVHELIVCVTGSAYLCTGDKQHRISRTRTVLVPAGMSHHYEVVENGEPANSNFICFEGRLPLGKNLPAEMQAGFNKLFANKVTSATLDNGTAEEVIELAAMLKRTLASNKPYSEEKAFSILNTILVSHLTALDHSNQAQQVARFEEIQKIIDWIDRHFAEEISIGMAAEKAHMSRSVFTRCFKKHTGLTFVNYVTNARQKFAADMLARENLSIGEVAYQCGYKNLGHFYARFQERYGMTPDQYRKVALEMTSPAAVTNPG